MFFPLLFVVLPCYLVHKPRIMRAACFSFISTIFSFKKILFNVSKQIWLIFKRVSNQTFGLILRICDSDSMRRHEKCKIWFLIEKITWFFKIEWKKSLTFVKFTSKQRLTSRRNFCANLNWFDMCVHVRVGTSLEASNRR